MNELSLIPSTREFCERSDIIGFSYDYLDKIHCLYYPEASVIIKTLVGLFRSFEIETLDFSKYDFSNVENFSSMFAFSKVQHIIGLNCSDKCESMQAMCKACYNLLEFDASRLDTSGVESFEDMFSCCNSLQHLDLTNISFTSTQHTESMFYGCHRLESLQLPNTKIKHSEYKDMFYGVPKQAIEKLSNSWREMYNGAH